MLPNLNLDKILKSVLKNGGEYADIFSEKSQSTSIVCEENKIEKVITGSDSGAGLRLIFKGRTFYAYTNKLSNSSLQELAETVRGSISKLESKQDVTINLLKKESPLEFKILKHPHKVAVKEKVGLVKEANKLARSIDSRIRQVMVIYKDHIQQVQIANSNNRLVEDERINLVALVQVVAVDGEVIQSGYEPIGGHIGFELFDADSLLKVAEKAAKRAVLMLNAQMAPAGKMPVVLSSEAGGTMIHEAVGHGLEADLAQQGLSVYSNQIGEQIASPLITVIDDATLPNKRGSFKFDDEGIEAQRTVLIENGILKGYMYDCLSAQKNDKVSTGNGRRQSYRYKPIPRMTNTFIMPGKSDPDDIVKSTRNGLFVVRMGGGQVNTVNGDFVFEISEGYLIKDGKISDPVRGATLMGNGPDVLKEIDMVGNDLGFAIGTCGKDGQHAPVSDAQPTLRIPEIIVGGRV